MILQKDNYSGQEPNLFGSFLRVGILERSDFILYHDKMGWIKRILIMIIICLQEVTIYNWKFLPPPSPQIMWPFSAGVLLKMSKIRCSPLSDNLSQIIWGMWWSHLEQKRAKEGGGLLSGKNKGRGGIVKKKVGY